MRHYIILLLLTMSSLSAFSDNINIGDTIHKKTYMENLSKLSEQGRKRQLKEDAAQLAQLLDTMKNVQIYVGFSFGVGNSNYETDSDKPFALPSADSVRADFEQLNTLMAEQNYELPYSAFEIKLGRRLNIVESKDINYNVKKAYIGNNTVALKDARLRTVDSLLIQATYFYPTAFDKLEVTLVDADSVQYKGRIINIERIGERSVEIEYPIGLPVIGYQGISQDGKWMNTTSRSGFPVYKFYPEAQKQLQELISTLNIAAQSANKEDSRIELEKISDTAFAYMATLNNLEKTYKRLIEAEKEDNSVFFELLKACIEDYSDILVPILQHVELTFPEPYSKIIIYVTTDTDSISREVIAQRYEDVFLQKGQYKVFHDRDNDRYGIVDTNNGTIFIAAQYKSMYQADNLYYTEFYSKRKDGDSTFCYYLNVPEKKLEKLPDDIQFYKSLDSRFTVFSKGLYRGILLNNKTELIPLKYDDIDLNGNIFIAKGSKRGIGFYDFYTTDGKLIALPYIVKEVDTKKGNPNIRIRLANRKYGVLNKDGVLVMPAEYDKIKFLNDSLIAFLKNKTCDMWGIADTHGNIVQQARFNRIGTFAEGMADIYNDLGGYINEEAEMVIQPQFRSVFSFYKGYALVRNMDWDFALIDKSGNIVKQFLPNHQVEFFPGEDEHTDAYYRTYDDDKKYNYKGDPIDN